MSPIRNIFEVAGELSYAAAQNELVYSWHDFTARGAAFGRGITAGMKFCRGGLSRPLAAPQTIRNGMSRLNQQHLRFCPFRCSIGGPRRYSTACIMRGSGRTEQEAHIAL